MHASVDSLCVCSMALGCELATSVIIIAICCVQGLARTRLHRLWMPRSDTLQARR